MWPIYSRTPGLYRERNYPAYAVALLFLAGLILLHGVWLSPERELLRAESEYAVQAQEFDFSTPAVTVHHLPTLSGVPLFPAAASGLLMLSGLPMETVLRSISLFMFAVGALLCGITAFRERQSASAGYVAAAVYLSSIVSLDKAANGTPVTTAALLLLSAQLAFFHYGIRKANWNAAWIASSGLICLGFLTGGLRVLIYFVFPMLFFRRPLSVKSKFQKPGFILALVLTGIILFAWIVSYAIAARKAEFLPLLDQWLYERHYFHELLSFPFELLTRLLPWTFIAWIPFCVALQATDTTPIFSRYLRTLILSSVLLLWFLPGHNASEFFYLLGPLAIQIGMFYGSGMQRYGNNLRRLSGLGELVCLIMLGIIGAVLFLPENWLKLLVSLNDGIGFRNQVYFQWRLLGVAVLIALLLAFLHFGRTKAPIWLMLLAAITAGGLLNSAVLAPYRAQNCRKRQLGNDIAMALLEEKAATKIYKTDLADLYGGLFYSGRPVYHLNSLEDLPENEEVVFIISADFPPTAAYTWKNLLPVGYRYLNHPIALWKGVKRQ